MLPYMYSFYECHYTINKMNNHYCYMIMWLKNKSPRFKSRWFYSSANKAGSLICINFVILLIWLTWSILSIHPLIHPSPCRRHSTVAAKMGWGSQQREGKYLCSEKVRFFNEREKQINWQNRQDRMDQWSDYIRAGRNALCCCLFSWSTTAAGLMLLGLFSHKMFVYLHYTLRHPADRD